MTRASHIPLLARPLPYGSTSRLQRRWLRPGLTLVELIVSTIIAGAVLVTLMSIYSHARQDAVSVSSALEKSELPERILQLLAQDLDRLLGDSEDVIFVLHPRQDGNLNGSSIIIESSIYDTLGRARTYERVTWQTRFDAETQSMILYRGHTGLVSEDRLLESRRTEEERAQLVPLCDGLTYFHVTARVRGRDVPAFAGPILPTMVTVEISFAEPEVENNQYIIPPEKIISRTIAVNRSRKISYIFTEPNLAEPNLAEPAAELNDPDVAAPTGDPDAAADTSRQGGTP